MYMYMYWKLSVIYWFLFIKRIKKKKSSSNVLQTNM